MKILQLAEDRRLVREYSDKSKVTAVTLLEPREFEKLISGKIA
jgi:hypothetical protein